METRLRFWVCPLLALHLHLSGSGAQNCIANQNTRWVDMEDDEVTDEVMVTVLEEDFHGDGPHS